MENRKTMADYVKESAEMMRHNIENSAALTDSLVTEYLENAYQNIWMVASGSSYNGCECARLFLQKMLKCQVKLVSPFQFLYADHDVPDRDMVVFVSQSGYSRNTIEAAAFMKKRGRKAVILTGDMDSDAKKMADLLIDFGVGMETVGYVTKGVNALALYWILFAYEVAKKKKTVSSSQLEQFWQEIISLPSGQEMVLNRFYEFFEQNFKIFSSMQNAYVCSYGANLGTAMEAALKIGETIQIPAVAYELEEYIHGPNLQLTPNYTILFIDGGTAGKRCYEIFQSTKNVTDKTILLTSQTGLTDERILSVPLSVREELTPLCFLSFFQLMAFEVTQQLHRWEKHPLQLLMKEKVAAKTANYINSPLKIHTPG